ncbi:MAG: FecR domain-containing protein [Brevundimonas sp.]|uniref:FecR family protein n=1 Tax=Brevundimonas sp. TaxID=1871086 RepID=UPI0025C0CB08|nr:FecR domain-containing protein [Brevundimonas sp.]MCH4269660.1 FecR domain-containing protein [Brevundimonas sp.]
MATPTARVETAEAEAAAWHDRLGARNVTTQEIEDFFVWRRTPANADAYRRLEAFWAQTKNLAGDKEIAKAVDDAMSRRAGRRPRLPRTSLGMAAAGAAVVLAFAGWIWWQGRTTFATTVGEQRVVQLADGSSVRLDTGSRIRVRFAQDQRLVELEAGQAMFDVASDRERPFVVQAGQARVTAVGTVFDVRRNAGGASVTLVSGVVEVASGRNGRATRMSAGQQARVAPRETRVEAVDVALETSWTDGRIVLRDTPLAEAVAEVNRYLTAKVELAPGRLEGVAVNGVFKIGDRDAFVSTVSGGLDLQATRQADGSIVLAERTK